MDIFDSQISDVMSGAALIGSTTASTLSTFVTTSTQSASLVRRSSLAHVYAGTLTSSIAASTTTVASTTSTVASTTSVALSTSAASYVSSLAASAASAATSSVTAAVSTQAISTTVATTTSSVATTTNAAFATTVAAAAATSGTAGGGKSLSTGVLVGIIVGSVHFFFFCELSVGRPPH